jgi:50S ribosomal subunit-associated GTPase HflX
MATRLNRSPIRAIVAALVSANASDTDERIRVLTTALVPYGVEVVGSLIQRRGVSRGGTKRMEAPLNSATLIGPGKALELAQLVHDRQAAVVYFLNDLSSAQSGRLAALTECPVISCIDESRPRAPT